MKLPNPEELEKVLEDKSPFYKEAHHAGMMHEAYKKKYGEDHALTEYWLQFNIHKEGSAEYKEFEEAFSDGKNFQKNLEVKQ